MVVHFDQPRRRDSLAQPDGSTLQPAMVLIYPPRLKAQRILDTLSVSGQTASQYVMGSVTRQSCALHDGSPSSCFLLSCFVLPATAAHGCARFELCDAKSSQGQRPNRAILTGLQSHCGRLSRVVTTSRCITCA